jgi:hypothetical protein
MAAFFADYYFQKIGKFYNSAGTELQKIEQTICHYIELLSFYLL